MLNKLILLLFGIFILLGIVLILVGLENSKDVGIRFYTRITQRETKVLNKVRDLPECPSKKYLLLGDSHSNLLANLQLEQLNFCNLSINGGTTQSAMLILNSAIDWKNVDITVIELGYNDLKYRSPEKLKCEYNKLLQRLPLSETYIISLFPVKETRSWVNQQIVDMNHFLSNLCLNQASLHFINIHPYLLNEKGTGLNTHLTTDGVHLNIKGQQIYLHYLKDILESNSHTACVN